MASGSVIGRTSVGRNAGRSVGKTFVTLAIAALMVAVVVLSSLSFLIGSDAETESTSTVTYHVGDAPSIIQYNDNSFDKRSIKIEYYGIPIAEYNPQFWSDGICGKASGTVQNWYSINSYVEQRTIVFTGWKLANSQGEVTDNDVIHPGTSLADEGENIHLVATWDTLSSVRYVDGEAGWVNDGFNSHNEVGYSQTDATSFEYALDGYHELWVQIDGIDDSAGPYRSIIILCGNYGSIDTRTIDKSVTIRSLDSNNIKTLNFNNWSIDRFVIIDNVNLHGSGGTTSQDHTGIYANFNRFILGTNVNCSQENGSYVQVAGGPSSGSSDSSPTDIRIFSGTYSNIIGGGGADGNGNNGYTGDIFETHVTIAGTTSVLESVIGGSVNAHVDNTYVLIVGGNVNAHTVGQAEGSTWTRGDMSTVIGGSRFGTVGSSHVTISGDAKIYAVQGGGRQANSHTGSTYVTVSGKPTIELLCGSVTDGNSYGKTPPVDDAHIHITGSPTIGNVYGGGWDIWAKPDYPSTGTTSIIIDGNEGMDIGGVYGGGFRGTVGVSQSTIAVTIDISGQGQIDSVYGGGRGGEDPVYNFNETGDRRGPGADDLSGPAKVVGDVTITITGGTVGSVYGGGQGSDGGHENCASIEGDITVSITGSAIVTGNVYGGGKGVSGEPGVGAVIGSTSTAVGCVVNGSVYGGGENAGVGDESEATASVAVSGTVKGSVYGGGENGAVQGGTSVVITGTVEKDVYGGGKQGSVSKSTYVEIADGATVSGNVFGAGFGSASDAKMALVSGGSTVRVSGVVKKSVYGGGNLASVGSTDVRISSAEVYGSVYGGGNGQDGIEGSAQVHGDVAIDIVDSTIGSQSSGGSVYGGGHGVSATSGDASIAAVTGSVSVSVSGRSTVNGDVYGGGMYGTVGVSHTGASTISVSDYIEISLIGGDIRIIGSVYGGGLGESERTATNVGQRTITINGPSIDGSVYGGSRYGDDNYGNVSGLSHGDVLILIVSGNIASGSSGNVYGGGYIGHSDLSSEIRIGSATEMSPVVDHLRIKSVFGGPSVGEPSDGGGQTVLMEGDARITISNGFGSAYSDFSITGDIFGEGDYCAIRGQATVWIEDFRQDADMLSIQKADELRILGSEIVLDGNMDGSTTQASSKLSLNLIGNLILQKSSERATKITLNAAASQISGYSSYDCNPTPGYGDEVGNVPNFSDSDVTMNTIVVNEGMILSILGIGDNAISADGVIQGYTLMESDARGYYGALAAGVTDNVMVGSTGFYVFTERGPWQPV